MPGSSDDSHDDLVRYVDDEEEMSQHDIIYAGVNMTHFLPAVIAYILISASVQVVTLIIVFSLIRRK